MSMMLDGLGGIDQWERNVVRAIIAAAREHGEGALGFHQRAAAERIRFLLFVETSASGRLGDFDCRIDDHTRRAVSYEPPLYSVILTRREGKGDAHGAFAYERGLAEGMIEVARGTGHATMGFDISDHAHRIRQAIWSALSERGQLDDYTCRVSEKPDAQRRFGVRYVVMLRNRAVDAAVSEPAQE